MVEAKGSFTKILHLSVCVNGGGRKVVGFYLAYVTERSLISLKMKLCPAAREFVRNADLCGLTPEEIFRAMNAREGLIDTAVKTLRLDV